MARKRLLSQLRAAIDEIETAQGEIDRLSAARVLRQLADQVERDLVGEARAAGVRWIDIGELYGTSKQSVQQRFRPRAR